MFGVGPSNFKLFKHKLIANCLVEPNLPAQLPNNKYERNSLESFVTSLMIQHAQAHTSFRFVIRNESLEMRAVVRI